VRENLKKVALEKSKFWPEFSKIGYAIPEKENLVLYQALDINPKIIEPRKTWVKNFQQI